MKKLRHFKFPYILNTEGNILAHNRFHAKIRLKRKHNLEVDINDIKEKTNKKK